MTPRSANYEARFELVTVASEALSIVVAPQLGGRLIELTDLNHGRQWLWRNHRTSLGPVAQDAPYDDVWQGGFEELFPNDAPTEMNGSRYPDHGELWSVPWDLVDATEDSIALSTTGRVTEVAVTKRFQLKDASLSLHYSLNNPRDEALPYLFKLHTAIDIHPECRIDLGGGIVEKVDESFGNLLQSDEATAWPVPGVDLSRPRPSDSRTNEFVYVKDLPEGWCGITDESTGSWVRIDYSTEAFPYCWIFMTYGGWRDHNVIVLEPCTNYPKDLNMAIANGTSAVLPPLSTAELEIRITVGGSND